MTAEIIAVAYHHFALQMHLEEGGSRYPHLKEKVMSM